MRLRVGHIQDDMDDESREPIELTDIFHEPPAEDEEDDVIYQWVRDRGGPVLDGPGGQPDPTIAAAMDPNALADHMSSDDGQAAAAASVGPSVPFVEPPGRLETTETRSSSGSSDDADTIPPSQPSSHGGSQAGGGVASGSQAGQQRASPDSPPPGPSHPTYVGRASPISRTYTRSRKNRSNQEGQRNDDASMQDLELNMGSISLDDGYSGSGSQQQSLPSWQSSEYLYGDYTTGSEYTGYSSYGDHANPQDPAPGEYAYGSEGGLLTEWFRNPYPYIQQQHE